MPAAAAAVVVVVATGWRCDRGARGRGRPQASAHGRGHLHLQSRVERVRLIGQAREVQGLQEVHVPHQANTGSTLTRTSCDAHYSLPYMHARMKNAMAH